MHKKAAVSLSIPRIEIYGKSCYNDYNKGQGKAPKTRKGNTMTRNECTERLAEIIAASSSCVIFFALRSVRSFAPIDSADI